MQPAVYEFSPKTEVSDSVMSRSVRLPGGADTAASAGSFTASARTSSCTLCARLHGNGAKYCSSSRRMIGRINALFSPNGDLNSGCSPIRPTQLRVARPLGLVEDVPSWQCHPPSSVGRRLTVWIASKASTACSSSVRSGPRRRASCIPVTPRCIRSFIAQRAAARVELCRDGQKPIRSM